MNHYVTPAIAKETLGVSLQTLRRWAKAGKIKHFRTPGGQFRYDLGSVGIAPSVSRPVETKPAPVVERIVSRAVEPPLAAKQPVPTRMDAVSLKMAVEGLARASAL